LMAEYVAGDIFKKNYQSVFDGEENWQKIDVIPSVTYNWEVKSTYIKLPPFIESTESAHKDSEKIAANILAIFGDSITTDHISPAGSIKPTSPAGMYLQDKCIKIPDLNSYGSRRGNYEVMMRGTFANIRLKNEMVPEAKGGFTLFEDEIVTIFEASRRYKKLNKPLVIIAGKEYGSGSSRDWAAKGPNLLGVKAIIAVSFERIHRSNLVGMGILPLEFPEGSTWQSLALTGKELVEITMSEVSVGSKVTATITHKDGDGDGNKSKILLNCRIDTPEELSHWRSGGILPAVLNNLTKESCD